jgi:hypothetical protein
MSIFEGIRSVSQKTLITFTDVPKMQTLTLLKSQKRVVFDTADGDKAHRGTPFAGNLSWSLRPCAPPLRGRAPRRRLAGANPQVVGRQDDLTEEREQCPNEGQHGGHKEQDNHGSEIHPK